MVDIAFFDFDGTITDTDSFTPFLYFAIDPKRLRFGRLRLAPLILGYKIGLVSGSRLRSAIFKLGFKGIDAAALISKGQTFSQQYIPNFIRPQALERIQWHLDRGDQVVVVSASIDVYLKPWCDALGLALICSEIEVHNGQITGRYLNKDCSALIKKQRILAQYQLADFNEVYVYGDTPEDRDMLSLGTQKFYQWRQIN